MDRAHVIRAITANYSARARLAQIETAGFQQITKDQIKAAIKECDLTKELLGEELRLFENTTATDQGAYVGVNG